MTQNAENNNNGNNYSIYFFSYRIYFVFVEVRLSFLCLSENTIKYK